jgi:hypothetical protein
MRALLSLVLLGCCAGTPALAVVIPDCAGATEIARAQVVRVEKNGALILSDGRAVLLEGIRLPTGAVGDQALDRLKSLAMGRALTLTAVRPKEDRYDRIRVQAFAASGTRTLWLQMELLKAGLARVQIAPDRGECAPDLYDAEREGRDQRAGLWADASYAVRAPAATAPDIGNYEIVEGRLTDVGRRGGRLILEFDSGRRQFSASVAPEDMRPFRDFDPPFDFLVGKRLRIRGTVEERDGHPDIALSNPSQIEVLQ